ncbi:hypothetical protein [Pararhodobacter sp.]|uniref:hypothetical protein n=1 Tax=Pararhodobacter sp. TaxID=2127056 RepID=UPI002FDD4D67
MKINKIITANPVVKALTRCLRKNPRASARFFSTPALPPHRVQAPPPNSPPRHQNFTALSNTPAIEALQ